MKAASRFAITLVNDLLMQIAKQAGLNKFQITKENSDELNG